MTDPNDPAFSELKSLDGVKDNVLLEVLGMGKNIEEAFNMAMRSITVKGDEHGRSKDSATPSNT